MAGRLHYFPGVPRSQLLIAGAAVLCRACFGYSVLTHEAIIDSSWESHIKPLLQQRFPDATAQELKEAHAYVYGGCVIQDLGYVPFASRFFSDLTHYVRTGDFVAALLRDAQDLNQTAFAIGALAHYAADTTGHPAVNRTAVIVYPKLRRKFGEVATYEDDPSAHLKTEFGLDVLQVARGLYISDSYHAFIGFKVSKPVLEQAFRDTYGIELKDVFTSLDLAIGTYRRSVGALIPEMTKVAWQTKMKEIAQASPGMTRKRYLFRMSRREYEAEWKEQCRKPGIGARILAILFRIIPKIGPFRPLAFRPVTSAGERLFLQSFTATAERYRFLLNGARQEGPNLAEMNLDTGRPTRAGEYRMADEAYCKLLGKLAGHNFEALSPELASDIIAFFGENPEPPRGSKSLDGWRKALDELAALRRRSVSMPHRNPSGL